MYKMIWSKLFKDFNEAKMVVLEWDNDRRDKYENSKTWDYIISKMFDIEMTNYTDAVKIQKLMQLCNNQMMFPTSQMVKRDRLVNMIGETKDKINYYRNNPEEEE